jgi:predicted DNA-binding protein (UPF0251 family)
VPEQDFFKKTFDLCTYVHYLVGRIQGVKIMPKPRKDRIVAQPPLFRSFKPAGQRRRQLPKIILSLDEYEAIRLADYLGYDHSKAAVEMEISRSTFTRLVEKARHKLAQFILAGKELAISGGKIHVKGNRMRCLDCGEIFLSDFEATSAICQRCNSVNIEDLARSYGHDRCCKKRQRNRR